MSYLLLSYESLSYESLCWKIDSILPMFMLLRYNHPSFKMDRTFKIWLDTFLQSNSNNKRFDKKRIQQKRIVTFPFAKR